MCYNFNLFYISYFKFLCNFFLKFIVYTIDPEMVKSGMVMLPEREGCLWTGCCRLIQTAAEALVVKSEREN
jgi:hypothetical protein